MDSTENVPDSYNKLISYLNLDETQLNQQRQDLKMSRKMQRETYPPVNDYFNAQILTATEKTIENQILFIKLLEAENDLNNGVFESNAIDAAGLSRPSPKLSTIDDMDLKDLGEVTDPDMSDSCSKPSNLDTLADSRLSEARCSSISNNSSDYFVRKFPSFYSIKTQNSIITNCYSPVDLEHILTMLCNNYVTADSMYPNTSSPPETCFSTECSQSLQSLQSSQSLSRKSSKLPRLIKGFASKVDPKRRYKRWRRSKLPIAKINNLKSPKNKIRAKLLWQRQSGRNISSSIPNETFKSAQIFEDLNSNYVNPNNSKMSEKIEDSKGLNIWTPITSIFEGGKMERIK